MGIPKNCKNNSKILPFWKKNYQERFEFKTKNEMGIYYLYKNLYGLTIEPKKGKYRYIL